MATPDLFSDVADNAFVAKSEPQGVLAQKAIVTIPAAQAADSIAGMIRFQEGFNLVSLAIVSEDLDSATNVTLDVGYVYDSASLTDDEDAFFDGIDIVQDAGSVVWPIADGLLTGTGFVSEGDGYISVSTKGAVTTDEGDITLQATFTYDN